MGIHRPSSKPRSKEFLVVFDFAHVNGLCSSSVSTFEVVVLCVSDMKGWCLLHWLVKIDNFSRRGFLLQKHEFAKIEILKTVKRRILFDFRDKLFWTLPTKRVM